MKKIVFCNIMMMKKFQRFCYKVTGNSTIEYDGEVAFPINGVLARMLRKDDDVKVVLLKKEDPDGNSTRNVEEFKNELDAINSSLGAKIEYKVLPMPHNEDSKEQEKLFKGMVGELVEGAEIYADITYSAKSLPILVFSVLSFAERFFSADIKSIVYGQVSFDAENKPYNPKLFDMTRLFYMNVIANTMECEDGEAAKKMLDAILSE
ncbi:MAG: TM1812 family CRISPR-associated protein [Treponema sp.]|nr:TM1812 family CRISPR-associated protein [Treponema sp.]